MAEQGSGSLHSGSGSSVTCAATFLASGLGFLSVPRMDWPGDPQVPFQLPDPTANCMVDCPL